MSTQTQDKPKPALTLVGPCRASYANLWKARKNLRDEMQYDIVLLFPKENNEFCPDAERSINAAKMGIKAAADAKFPAGAKYGVPLLDGDKEGKYPGFYYMTAKSSYAPAVVGPDLVPVRETDEWASGDWVKANLSFYGGESPQGAKNVGCGLRSIQFVKHDEHFGSERGSGVENFEPVDGYQAPASENTGEEYDPFANE